MSAAGEFNPGDDSAAVSLRDDYSGAELLPNRSFHSSVGNEPLLDRPRRGDMGKLNRCLAALPAKDFLLLQPHLRTVPLERGTVLHDTDDEIEHVFFPLSGMVSLVAIMRNGATVETASAGRQRHPWRYRGIWIASRSRQSHRSNWGRCDAHSMRSVRVGRPGK